MLVGSEDPQKLADFYTKVFGKESEMPKDGGGEGDWFGWLVGNTFFSIGHHSELSGNAKEPQRILLNFETTQVNEEYERLIGIGATPIQAPYQMQGAWIATLADPDGNYFQLMTPWEPTNKA